MDTQQFGNIKSISTSHCLVSLLDLILSHLDKRNTYVALAFIDFKKAFDLVDYTVLLNKVIETGLNHNLTAWLADFLTDRRHAVRYQGAVSSIKHLTCGVPQGTNMGPLCFLVLINDALTDTSHRWKYVDDCTVGILVNNRTPDYSTLQATLDRLQVWAQLNNVSINQPKTVVMYVCTSVQEVAPNQLTIGPHPLQVIPTFKLLGVTLNNHLSWKQHVASMVKTASYKLYMLRCLRSLGTQSDELKRMYTLLILPELVYASPIWSSSLNVTQSKQLERVQRRECKVILGPAYIDYDNAVVTLNLPRLTTTYKHALTKFDAGLLQISRYQHLLPPEAPHQRTTRHQNLLVPVKARAE